MSENSPVSTLLLVPSLNGGGTERLVSILARSFDRSRVDPAIVVLHEGGAFTDGIPDDVPIIPLPKRSKADLPLLIWRLARILEDRRPGVAIGFMTYANTLLLAARRIAAWKPSVVATEHSSPALRRSGVARHLRNRWARHLYPDAARLVVVSDRLGEEIASLHPALSPRLSVIPNPFDPAIDAAVAGPRPAHPWFAEDVPVLVAVGRLAEEKGYADLIVALELLNRERPVRAVIVGEGPERARLQEMAGKRGVADRLDLIGFQRSPFGYMAHCSAFVHPAHSEAFGMVLVEAARCGAAIVATDCDFGPREIIVSGRSGLLVPPGDPAALASAVNALLTDAALVEQLRQGARQRAESFTPEAIAGRYTGLIAAVAHEGTTGG